MKLEGSDVACLGAKRSCTGLKKIAVNLRWVEGYLAPDLSRPNHLAVYRCAVTMTVGDVRMQKA